MAPSPPFEVAYPARVVRHFPVSSPWSAVSPSRSGHPSSRIKVCDSLLLCGLCCLSWKCQRMYPWNRALGWGSTSTPTSIYLGLTPQGLAVAGAVGRHAPGMGPGLREQQAGWVSPPLTSSPLRWPGQRAGDQRGKGELTKKSQKVFACHSVLGYLSCALGCCPLRCFCEVPDGLGQMPLQCPFLLKPHCAGAVGSPPTHVASTRPSSAHWPLPV